MANLLVRNIDDSIASALKIRASQHGISAEEVHRRILELVTCGKSILRRMW